MPIVIPTTDEIERMDGRQRAALVRRVPAQRAAFEESMALLVPASASGWTGRVRTLLAAKYRSLEIEDARLMLDLIAVDPEGPRRLAMLEEAIA